MNHTRRAMLILSVVVLLILSLSLAGCRQDDATVTPEARPRVQQMIPLAGGGSDSPLPTPGIEQSPLKP